MIKKFTIISLIILSIAILFYRYNIYPYNWNKAEENFNKYIAQQGINKSNIKSLKKMKETTIGGIQFNVIFKDDSDLIYQYVYSNIYDNEPYNIVLGIYKGSEEIGLTNIKAKYSPLQK